MTLNEGRVGSSYCVVKLNGMSVVRRRIMDMGLTKGTTLYIRKVAPLGDPIQVSLRGYELSFRKQDAEFVEVREIFAKKSAV